MPALNLATQVLVGGLVAWTGVYAWRWRQLDAAGRSSACFDLLGPALVALRMWVGKTVPLYAMPIAPFDDRIFLRQATSLLAGDWLGPYDQLMLVKGPFYSMFWAASHWAGIAITNAHVLVYALAAWLLVVALRQREGGMRWWAQLAAFIIVLFCPVLQETVAFARAWRQPLWVGLPLIVTATAIGLMLSGRRPRSVGLAWAAGLGVALGAAWLTREEAIWLAAPVAVALGGWLWAGRRAQLAWRDLAMRGAPLLLAPVVVGAVAWTNYQHYGMFGIVEYRDKAFLDAYGALTRVEPHDPDRRVPLTHAARESLYAVCPTFAELRPELEGGIGAIFMQVTQENTGIPATEQEIGGGWMMWALRDAVWNLGYAPNYPASRDFYAQLAAEVNAAVDSGVLAGGPRRASMRPAWDWSVFGPKLPAAVEAGFQRVYDYRVNIQPWPSMGSEEDLAWTARLAGQAAASIDASTAAAQTNPGRQRFWAGVIVVYQGVIRWLAIVAAVGMPGLWLWAAARLRWNGPAWAALVGVGGVAANVAVVAAVHVSSWDAVHIGYLGPSLALGLVPLTAMLAWVGGHKQKGA